MNHGYLFGTVDVAEVSLAAFFLFFLLLVFWLRREDRREGYPLENEISGNIEPAGSMLGTALPKRFILPFDRGVASFPLPRGEGREPVNIAARRPENHAGSPYDPTGNPLVDGIGPAAYAERARWPDQDMHGRPRIIPMASQDSISVYSGNRDPRGMKVTAADGLVAGTVRDVWIDRSEHIIRYLEVETNGGRIVLAPMAMASVSAQGVSIDAINAADFEAVPALSTPGEITRYEEDRIVGYYGGGYLYANADRLETFL